MLINMIYWLAEWSISMNKMENQLVRQNHTSAETQAFNRRLFAFKDVRFVSVSVKKTK